MFPTDYDGIVAGSPGVNWSGRALLSIWVGQAVAQAPIPREKFEVLNKAAVGACDANDGVRDGVIENPLQCKFDPQVVQCKEGDAADCLTPAQVATARKIYSPATHSRTKQTLVAGFSPGSELGWNTMAGPQPFGLGVDLFKYIVFSDPNWDFKTFNWDTHVDQTLAASKDMDALDPNLKPFFDRGGKIISYHGWSDPQISPGSTVGYYESVMARMGGAGKVQVHDISITKFVDKSTTGLMLACAGGKHIPKGLITVRKAGEKPLEYLKIKLTDILISGVQFAGHGGDQLTENVTLNLAKFEVEYQEQKADGTGVAAGQMGWDLKKNEKV